jgi:hypothetical protein
VAGWIAEVPAQGPADKTRMYSQLGRALTYFMQAARRYGPKRARHDTDQLVTAFAARRQGAVNLGAVRDDLTGVVHTALEPSHVSVWARQP